MSWMIAATLGGAALGAYQNKTAADAAQKQQKAQMIGNAAQIQYSPWTHAAVQMQGNNAADPNSAMIEGGLQGGLTGAMMGKQFAGKPAAPGASNFDAGSQMVPQEYALPNRNRIVNY